MSIAIIIQIMSWYSGCNDASRKLDALLDKQPTFEELLTFPDFTQHLKTFNPKLLDYVSSSQEVPQRIVEFLTVPPCEDIDSNDRKYKFPVMTIEVVEIEAACILNSLFRETNNKGETHLIAMFNLLRSSTLLPMLAGYFHRTILALFRSRFRDTVESVYSHKEVFDLMIQHCEESTVASCLSMFLNLQSTKCNPSSEERVQFKISVVRKIMDKVEEESRKKQSMSSALAVQNLIAVLKESVEKYCMVADGKKILDTILSQKFITLIIGMMEESAELSVPAMDLCLSLIKYYSFSSYNLEEGNEQQMRRNMQRLESQPFVVRMHSRFSDLLKKVKNAPKMTLYHYKLIEVLCHCMTLSSRKIFDKIKESELYPTLIELLFKHEKCSILHKLIERAFLHVFVTEKKIYELYKVYFFCQISIIELTVERLLTVFPQNVLSGARKKGYFGEFMKIIKIYSNIETNNDDIRNAITEKAKIWSKASREFIKPYEQLVKEELGKLQNVAPMEPLQFTVRQVEKMHPFIENTVALEEVKKEEETMPMTLESSEQKREELGMSVSATVIRNYVKIEEDEFFKQPIEGTQASEQEQQENDKNGVNEHQDIFTGVEESGKPATFNDYMNKRMAEAETEIRLQRSISGEKRLSAGKRPRMASPSPNRKKNSWKEDLQEDKNPKLPKKEHLKIPVPSSTNGTQNMSKSALQLGSPPQPEQTQQLSLSMANMQSLKHTRIVRINVKPEQKRYRRIQEKDKALLIYLGIKC